MQSEMPFYESPEDALRDAIRALGGTKKVGQILWPDKTIDAAARLLHDCLNTSRPEKLDITQVMHILRLAKEGGCYAPLQWIAGEIGFNATPISRADEEDRLATIIEQSTKTLTIALRKLEGLK